MPGETFQTLKSKATQQAKQSGMSQSAAENYGSAMASQAAQVGGAVTPVKELSTEEMTGGHFEPEFFGGAQNTGADIGADILEALSGSTQAPLEQIAARKEAEKKMQEAGGVFNPNIHWSLGGGQVIYPEKTKLGLGSLNVNDVIDKIPSLTLKGIIGGAKGLQLLLDKAFKPQLEDFSNPNFLAVLDAAFKSGKLNEESWKETYGDLLDDAYGGQGIGSLDQATGDTSLDSEGLFDLAMEEATANVEPGSSVQRITNPSEFYTGEQNLTSTGRPIMPQTSGGLADLAGLAVTPEMQGNNPELAKMIFEARATLDRMNKDPFTGNPQGGGQVAGIPSIPGIPSLPVPRPGPIPPDSYPLPPTNPWMPGPGLPPWWEGSKFEKPAPYDYYAQSPQYKFGGVPSLNTNEFNEQLRKLYGIG